MGICDILKGKNRQRFGVMHLKEFIHKMPSNMFVRANIKKSYCIPTREIVELLINNIIINYYHHYGLQEIISFIII